MLRNNFLFRTAVLAAFLGLTAVPASAEWLQQRVSRGNNVGLGMMSDWCCPLITASWTGNTIQYPKGSGNLILNDAWTIGMMTANDIDGDGAAEDTAVLGSGGRDSMPYRCSVEARDVLIALSQAGENMETAASSRAGTGINRIWTSLDASELAEWPVEARMGHTEGGEPIIHGAETMFEHTGDVFNSWGAPLSGYYQGWSFYFLDFAESNSMAYGHNYIQNVTEYMKWNPSYGATMWTDGSPAPDAGWTWKGMIMFNNWRQMGFGSSSNLGWCYHAERDIVGLWSKSPLISNWTPSEPPLLAIKVLKYPELNGEQIKLINIHTVAGGEFGISSPGNLLASGLSYPKVYGAVKNTAGLYPGVTNPFTGKPMTDGYPGILTPDDARYGQWIWGGGSNWNHYTFWGEMHDVAPRDSMTLDWVIMFTPTGVTPLVHPTYDLANIDDPTMQEGFAPLERWADVAQTVYEGGYVVPATPAPPPLTIVPGDRQVTLTWSDINLKTPDVYAVFLRDHPELDPDGVYREYDFEGFRIYRSFVGPNDSHSEQIADFNVSSGNVQFYFIDKIEDDNPYYRMRNGMKVWYALVPYDLNYDPATGKSFNLPDPSSGKVWNRAGEAGLYNVIPRSEASNFKEAELAGVEWAGITDVVSVSSVALSGSGGMITQAPQALEPINDIGVDVVNNERITSEQSAYISVTDMGPHGGLAGSRTVVLADASGNLIDELPQKIMVNGRGGSWEKDLIFSGGMSDEGIAYSISLSIEQRSIRRPGMQIQLDPGGYSGADIGFATYRWSEGNTGTPVFTGANTLVSYTRAGQFNISWGSSGGGLTCTVQDVTHGKDIPFSPYIDEENWGFIVGGATYADITADAGRAWGGPDNELVPQSQRSIMLAETIPADNTEDFYLYVNGNAWKFTNISAMPASGASMTVIMAYGSWDGDTFNQVPEPIFPGDGWKITINPMSMDPEDADLSKVKVVPNPYVASSFLDLSVTQRRIEFINLPSRCTIRIYSLGGNLINVINHIGSNRSGWGNYTDWDRLTQGAPKEFTGYDNHSGTEPWNMRNRFGQTVASGLYFFHVTDERGETVTGKFYIVN